MVNSSTNCSSYNIRKYAPPPRSPATTAPPPPPLLLSPCFFLSPQTTLPVHKFLQHPPFKVWMIGVWRLMCIIAVPIFPCITFPDCHLLQPPSFPPSTATPCPSKGCGIVHLISICPLDFMFYETISD